MNVANDGAPNFSLDVLGKKIAFSTVVQYAGKAAQLVLATVTLKLVSNFLTQGGYGVYASISEYVLFFSMAANLGIFGNVVRMMADRPKDGSVFMNALALRVGTALLFFAMAVVIALFNGGDRVFMTGTILFCGVLFFDYVTSVCDGMLQANYLMGRATFALIAGKIVNLGLIWIIIRQFQQAPDQVSIPMLFGATLAGSLLTAGLSLYFVKKKIEWSWKVSVPLMLKIFEVSLPFGIINILNNLYFRFLPDYLSRGMLDDAHFASFSLYFRVAQVLSLASTFLMFSALPGLTEYIFEGHWQKAQKLYKKIRKILLAGGLALVVGGSLAGPTVLAALTHSKYVLPEFWFVLPMMLALAAVSYGYDLVLITLFAANEDVWFLKRELLALAVAGVFFALASFAFQDVTAKMALILAGAIAGESFMVITGMRKIRNILEAIPVSKSI